ncbi:MAG: hypothetical protein WBN77_05855 [Desulfobacterales bacterium]|uniref:Uncharacterized protein n=1 Tax=uncultured Desulfobacterium sp. TaxID=201089 RepID=E1YF99_9BACT|nr:unknown protein [uncultured Desulfobacterium sp.]
MLSALSLTFAGGLEKGDAILTASITLLSRISFPELWYAATEIAAGASVPVSKSCWAITGRVEPPLVQRAVVLVEQASVSSTQ